MTDKPDLIRLDNFYSEQAIALALDIPDRPDDEVVKVAERLRIQLALAGYYIGTRPVIPAPHEAKRAGQTTPDGAEVAAVARAFMLQNCEDLPAAELQGLTPQQVADGSWPILAPAASRAIEALDKVRAEKS